MRGPWPIPDDADPRLADVGPGILEARKVARRLEQIVLEMGEGISERLYRGAQNMALRGEHRFITAEADSVRVFDELIRQGAPAAASRPALPDLGLPGDPRRLRAAWENMSAADRDELFHLDPFIGNRDGIPQADRDMYNRITLNNLRDVPLTRNNYRRQDAYRDLAEMLDDSQTGQPRIYLSYLDAEGRVAFSLDNPDFADNAVVLLQPADGGNSLNYGVPTARHLRQVALLAAPNARTSVTFWGNYDQPGSMVHAMFADPAREGTDRVRDFHDGLRATHEGEPAHTTTIGHSYASVLAGHAAGHGASLNTDNVLFIGSWGTGVNHAGELSLTGVAPDRNAEHIFATMADSDQVRAMPGTHGPLPTDPDFDATVIGARSMLPGHLNASDHGSQAYLDSANPASGNIGLIMTGHGDLVSRPDRS